jgi:iron complex transport system substrate-binding protein
LPQRLISERFITDDLARAVALEPPARRVVSLAPSCTDVLLAIGAHQRLVGIEEHSELPADLCAMPRVGGFKYVDLERVAALAPDLIVAASLHAVRLVPRLTASDARVFVSQPRTLDGIVDGMARLAALLGLAREAAPVVARARRRIAAVLERTLKGGPRPLVYVEFSPRGHTGGPQSFLDDLVTKAGGVNLGGVARVEWPVIPPSLVRRFDPDVIVIAEYPGSATPQSLVTRDGWDRLRAVKSGRVVVVPAPLIKRPGPLVLDGLDRLASLFAA